MSNHEIGHAMSSLGTDILKLYESGKISKEACISIIRSYIQVARYYDGNDYETTESIAEAGYCGLCFEKHGDLSDVFDNDDDIENGVYGAIDFIDEDDLFGDYWDIALHYHLCPECKAKVMGEYKKKMNLS
jgi:hypothetical protein